MTPSDIEKLKAIGYKVKRAERGNWSLSFNEEPRILAEFSEEAAWVACQAHAQSADGMKATMADKVRWLLDNGQTVTIQKHEDGVQKFYLAGPAIGESPDAAVDALFWKVP